MEIQKEDNVTEQRFSRDQPKWMSEFGSQVPCCCCCFVLARFEPTPMGQPGSGFNFQAVLRTPLQSL